MAKLNAVEADVEKAKGILLEILDEDELESVSVLIESADMGMMSFRVLSAIRPLVVSVWRGMSNNGDPRRFTLETMLKDIDAVIGHWVVPDEENDEDSEKEESTPSKK